MYRLITANRNYSSWSLRPWLLMKTLGITFEDEQVVFAGLNNYDAFRRFSPNGMVPALIDGECTIWDSLGITLYLADRHDGVWPADEAAKAWAQCVVCEMHSGFAALRNCAMSVGVRVRRDPDSPALKRDIARMAEIFEEGLSRFGGPWLAGESFTAADAFYAPVVFRIRSYDLPTGPRGAEWLQRMLELPAMREWERQALVEPHRDPPHEEDVAAVGTVIEDFRGNAG